MDTPTRLYLVEMVSLSILFRLAFGQMVLSCVYVEACDWSRSCCHVSMLRPAIGRDGVVMCLCSGQQLVEMVLSCAYVQTYDWSRWCCHVSMLRPAIGRDGVIMCHFPGLRLVEMVLSCVYVEAAIGRDGVACEYFQAGLR